MHTHVWYVHGRRDLICAIFTEKKSLPKFFRVPYYIRRDFSVCCFFFHVSRDTRGEPDGKKNKITDLDGTVTWVRGCLYKRGGKAFWRVVNTNYRFRITPTRPSYTALYFTRGITTTRNTCAWIELLSRILSRARVSRDFILFLPRFRPLHIYK